MRKGKREKENHLRTLKQGGKSKAARLSQPKETPNIGRRSIGQNADTIQIKKEIYSKSNVFPTAQVHNEAQRDVSKHGIKLGTVVIPPSTFLEHLSHMDESLVTNGFMLDLFDYMKAAKPFTWKEMKKALSLSIPSVSHISNSAFYSGCLAIKDKKLAMMKNCDKIKMLDFMTKKYNPPSAKSKKKHAQQASPSSTEVTSPCLSNNFMNEVTVNVNKDISFELERKKEEHALVLEDNLELKAKCEQLKAKNKELRSLVMVAGEPMIFAQTIKRKDASISLWKTRYLTLKAKKSEEKKKKEESFGSSKPTEQHGEGMGGVEEQESVKETNIESNLVI
uniref:uncharacterized protein n=1 Tax=Myxine glutinosa TaxID=7769 RepID=UPI00358ED157